MKRKGFTLGVTDRRVPRDTFHVSLTPCNRRLYLQLRPLKTSRDLRVVYLAIEDPDVDFCR